MSFFSYYYGRCQAKDLVEAMPPAYARRVPIGFGPACDKVLFGSACDKVLSKAECSPWRQSICGILSLKSNIRNLVSHFPGHFPLNIGQIQNP